VSGEQERLENLVNQAIWSTDAARVEAGTRT
jgi:hypothetical protein